MSTTIENRGFVTNSVLALKDFIVKPRLTKEQKKFVLENFEASQQEIKDLIAKYFYVKDDGTYDLKDENNREAIIRIFRINVVMYDKNFKILEKYFEGRHGYALKGREKKLFSLMRQLTRNRSICHDTFTKEEKRIYRVYSIDKYYMLSMIQQFELLEKYLDGKDRESLSKDDQALFDVIQRHGVDRQSGDNVNIEDHPVFENIPCKIADDDDHENSIFYRGLARYKKLDNVKKEESAYDDMSYNTLKKERAMLYKDLEVKEQ